MERESVWSERYKMNLHKRCDDGDINYKKALRFLRTFELIVGFSCAIYMMIVPEVRVQIEAKSPLETLFFMLFEMILWICVSGMVGKSHLPANYVCILFVKCFIFYDNRFKSKLSLLRPSWMDVALVFNLRSMWKNSLPWEKPLTFFSPLILIPAVTFLSNIYVGDYEVTSLVGMSASTTLAMGILVSAMGIERFGESVVTYHFRACLVWAYFTSIMTFFNLLFLTQRSWKYYKGKMSSKQFSRTLTEMMIYFLMIYLMTHYVPIIHQNFDFDKVYSLGIHDLISHAVPTSLKSIIQDNPFNRIWKVTESSDVPDH